jgi:hypothetical protein
VPDTHVLTSLMLWDIRAQVESQLRRIADAQQHWASLRDGAGSTHVGRVLASTDEFRGQLGHSRRQR